MKMMKKIFDYLVIMAIFFMLVNVSGCEPSQKETDEGFEITIGEKEPSPQAAETPKEEKPAEDNAEKPVSPVIPGAKTGEPEPEMTLNISCNDDDEGKKYYLKGNISGIENSTGQAIKAIDFCGEETEPKIMNEYYCQDRKVYLMKYSCPNGCREGACLSMPSSGKTDLITEPKDNPGMYTILEDTLLLHESSCVIEGDNGYEPLKRGSMTIQSEKKLANPLYESEYKGVKGTSRFKAVMEFCGEPSLNEGKFLNESYCDNFGRPHQIDLECRYGCSDGACKSS